MSVLEIKHQIERLTPDEQSQLESFLKARRLAESPDFRERVSAAHRRSAAGEAITSAQLRALLHARSTAAS
jgi:hypothetical protein